MNGQNSDDVEFLALPDAKVKKLFGTAMEGDSEISKAVMSQLLRDVKEDHGIKNPGIRECMILIDRKEKTVNITAYVVSEEEDFAIIANGEYGYAAMLTGNRN